MSIRLLGKNAIIYVVGNVALRGVAFFLIPVYTHQLSIKDYGLLASLFITIEFLVMLMSAGMRETLVRFYRDSEQNGHLGALIGTSTAINVVGGLIVTSICLTALVPLFVSVLHTEDVFTYILLACSGAFVQSLFLHVTSFYRARNEAALFTITSVSSAVLLLAANIVLLVYLRYGVEGALIAHVFSYGLMLALASIHVITRTGLRVSVSLGRELLPFGVPLIFSMCGKRIIGLASFYILSFYAGLEAVAIYALGEKLAKLLAIVIILPFQLAFPPYIYSVLERSDVKQTTSTIFTYLIYAFALFSFPVMVGARLLLPWLAPPEYALAFLVLLLMLPALVFQGVSAFGESLINVVRKTYINALVFGAVGVFSVFLNYALVPALGWYGAIVTLIVSHSVLGISILSLAVKAYTIRLEWRRLSVAAGIFAGCLFLSYWLMGTTDLVFCGFIVLAACAAIAFITLSNVVSEREREFLRRGMMAIQYRLSK